MGAEPAPAVRHDVVLAAAAIDRLIMIAAKVRATSREATIDDLVDSR